MTISINTNLAANNATVYLQANQAELDKSLTRLSSGSKVDQVTEDAEVQRLSAIVKRFKSAKVNLANAMSFTQTQSGYLKGIADALERMGELAMISNDETKSNDDRIAYNQEYKSLFEFIDESRKKAFNGRDLYNGESMKVSAGSDVADQFTLNGINLQHTTTNDDGDWEPQNSDLTVVEQWMILLINIRFMRFLGRSWMMMVMRPVKLISTFQLWMEPETFFNM